MGLALHNTAQGLIRFQRVLKEEDEHDLEQVEHDLEHGAEDQNQYLEQRDLKEQDTMESRSATSRVGTCQQVRDKQGGDALAGSWRPGP